MKKFDLENKHVLICKYYMINFLYDVVSYIVQKPVNLIIGMCFNTQVRIGLNSVSLSNMHVGETDTNTGLPIQLTGVTVGQLRIDNLLTRTKLNINMTDVQIDLKYANVETKQDQNQATSYGISRFFSIFSLKCENIMCNILAGDQIYTCRIESLNYTQQMSTIENVEIDGPDRPNGPHFHISITKQIVIKINQIIEIEIDHIFFITHLEDLFKLIDILTESKSDKETKNARHIIIKISSIMGNNGDGGSNIEIQRLCLNYGNSSQQPEWSQQNLDPTASIIIINRCNQSSNVKMSPDYHNIIQKSLGVNYVIPDNNVNEYLRLFKNPIFMMKKGLIEHTRDYETVVKLEINSINASINPADLKLLTEFKTNGTGTTLFYATITTCQIKIAFVTANLARLHLLSLMNEPTFALYITSDQFTISDDIGPIIMKPTNNWNIQQRKDMISLVISSINGTIGEDNIDFYIGRLVAHLNLDLINLFQSQSDMTGKSNVGQMTFIIRKCYFIMACQSIVECNLTKITTRNGIYDVGIGNIQAYLSNKIISYVDPIEFLNNGITTLAKNTEHLTKFLLTHNQDLSIKVLIKRNQDISGITYMTIDVDFLSQLIFKLNITMFKTLLAIINNFKTVTTNPITYLYLSQLIRPNYRPIRLDESTIYYDAQETFKDIHYLVKLHNLSVEINLEYLRVETITDWVIEHNEHKQRIMITNGKLNLYDVTKKGHWIDVINIKPCAKLAYERSDEPREPQKFSLTPISIETNLTMTSLLHIMDYLDTIESTNEKTHIDLNLGQILLKLSFKSDAEYSQMQKRFGRTALILKTMPTIHSVNIQLSPIQVCTSNIMETLQQNWFPSKGKMILIASTFIPITILFNIIHFSLW
jgi:hypothetical protein